MTFGTEVDWGADEATARGMFNHYVEAGGNFVDTADGYTRGTSEKMVGRFIAERGLRDRVVLATKFTFGSDQNNPNSGGNGRKNLYRAVEASLKRLQTDYIDVYWLHAWDTMTPVEEVMASIDALVRAGKVRYFGMSDVPAWYAARGQTIAELRGMTPIVALQLEYSLIERNIEREHIPLAQELGLGLCPWSPLAGGILTGKYRPEEGKTEAGRFDAMTSTALDKTRTERASRVLAALVEVAAELGRTKADVALNWVATRPTVTSTIVGARTQAQLEANLKALEFTIPVPLRQRLDEAGAIEIIHPYNYFEPYIQSLMRSGSNIRPWKPAG